MFGWSVDWIFVLSVNPFVDWLIGCLIDWLIILSWREKKCMKSSRLILTQTFHQRAETDLWPPPRGYVVNCSGSTRRQLVSWCSQTFVHNCELLMIKFKHFVHKSTSASKRCDLCVFSDLRPLVVPVWTASGSFTQTSQLPSDLLIFSSSKGLFWFPPWSLTNSHLPSAQLSAETVTQVVDRVGARRVSWPPGGWRLGCDAVWVCSWWLTHLRRESGLDRRESCSANVRNRSELLRNYPQSLWAGWNVLMKKASEYEGKC